MKSVELDKSPIKSVIYVPCGVYVIQNESLLRFDFGYNAGLKGMC